MSAGWIEREEAVERWLDFGPGVRFTVTTERVWRKGNARIFPAFFYRAYDVEIELAVNHLRRGRFWPLERAMKWVDDGAPLTPEYASAEAP